MCTIFFNALTLAIGEIIVSVFTLRASPAAIFVFALALSVLGVTNR